MIEAEISTSRYHLGTSELMDEHADQLRDYAQKVLSGWQASRDWEAAEQLKAASLANARDYRGRSLLELLQNAHDAHPGDRNDGRVHILIDETEGEHGTLYVANAGTPFTWERVMAICKLARSAKRVGDGIGNKGVGFRSVVELTTTPEIFSASCQESGGPLLNGYRFRFATTSADYLDLLGDEELAARAAEEMPPFQVPFPIADLPETCAELGADGNVTVIRLPLKSQSALEDATQLWSQLATAEVPVLLFLNRLEHLVLERRVVGADVERLVLLRQEHSVELLGQGEDHPELPTTTFAEVDLGELGEFLVIRGRVPVARLRDTVDQAVVHGDLDESWRDWAEPAVVEVALSRGEKGRRQGRADNRIYTFLPLGSDATAPLRGHINAPFFTKVDRTGINRQHRLNAMLLDAIAETCLIAAAALRKSGSPELRRAAIDLIAWDRPESSAQRLSKAALHVHGRELFEVSLVPVLDGRSPSLSWDTPANTVLWPRRESKVLTPEAAQSTGIPVADPAVGAERLNRLDALCRQLDAPLTPDEEQLADHVERIVSAFRLPRDEDALGDWNDLYVDLFRLFERNATVLRGRRLLLADDGKLRHFNGKGLGENESTARRHEAFFYPTTTETAVMNGITVPRTLRKRLFYVHPDLRWTNEADQPHRQAAQQFLINGALVRQFNIQGLLNHVQDELRQSASPNLRLQAMKFVFQLHRNRQGSAIAFKDLGLYVPTSTQTFLPAAETVFGAGWSNTRGDDLWTVVAEGRHASADLKKLESCFVASPQELTKHGGTQEEWRVFLSSIGVIDGLDPVFTEDADRWVHGSSFSAPALVSAAKTLPKIASLWEIEIRKRRTWAGRPRSSYRGTPAYRLPGQEIVAEFSQQGRLAYAHLVLAGLSRWSDELFDYTWTSNNIRDVEVLKFPTPLDVFVRTQPWLPVRNSDRLVEFVRPQDAWQIPEHGSGEPIPVQTAHPRVLDFLKSRTAQSRLRNLGMPTWDVPEDSGKMIAALGELVASHTVEPHIRKFIERANQNAWKLLTQRSSSYTFNETELEPLRKSPILVETGDSISVIRLTDFQEKSGFLYVSAERDNLTVQFIKESDKALLFVPGAADRAFALLDGLCPGKVKLVNAADMAVALDGQAPFSCELGDLLHNRIPWLAYAIGILADRRQAVTPPESEIANLVAAVRRIHLYGYTSLTVTLDGEPVQLPDRLAGVLPLPDEHSPVIAAPRVILDNLDWNALDGLAYAIAHVLGKPDLAPHLRLAAHSLRDSFADIVQPNVEDLARALEVKPWQYAETVSRIDGSLAGILDRLYPLLVHALGIERTRDLIEPRPSDIRQLQALLSPHDSDLPLPAERLINAARSAHDVGELREITGIGFAEFNESLLALIPRYQPISHAEAHEEALSKRVDARRSELIDRLRAAYLSHFDAHTPIPGWIALRSLEWIIAPRAWALTVDSATVDLLDSHINASLDARLRELPEPAATVSLSSWRTLRESNIALVRSSLPEIRTLIQAAGRHVSEALWGDAANFLDECGALDFRRLTKDDVVAWLATLGHWPPDMEQTMSPDAHGVTQASFQSARSSIEQARDERLRKRRVVTLGDRELDVASGDFTQVVAEVRRILTQNPQIITGSTRFASLKAFNQRGSTGTGGSRSGWCSGERRELSLEQRSAIGFIGEQIAYEWLRAHYPATNEESWVSTNRRKAFPGSSGDDSLGYDFKIGTDKRALMFEVKATQEGGGQIELGESEMRAAQRFAGSNRWSLLVVTWVLTPEQTTAHRLPNPFSAEGRNLYRAEGGSVRFSYRLDT
ncbi:DUF3883 domain-containing protein [Nonomuraea sp. NPDC050786]|uniref:sacsin N-terminal ATP-binding-like domain-containing protein n=1 Tax=Nonomuraea sp. NPDC050786 TaxID=3154840 RepID=UPI0033FA85CD